MFGLFSTKPIPHAKTLRNFHLFIWKGSKVNIAFQPSLLSYNWSPFKHEKYMFTASL